jgi:hypothetical protein
VYGTEKWAVNEMGMKTLGTGERIILRRIYRPVVERGIWRVRTDQELKELCKRLEIEAGIGMDWTCSKNGSGKDS